MAEPRARLDEWTHEPPPADVRRALERLRRAPGVRRVAVMPDVHLARDVCIGTVVATDRWLYPAAVGGDVGCGMVALAFDVEASALTEERAERLLERLADAIPIQRNPRDALEELPPELLDAPLSDPVLESRKASVARAQLGTLGRGNHFVELQADEEERLWAMVHSGSRGLGQALREHHEERGARVRGGLRALDAESPEGRAYLRDLDWGLCYAEANRARLLERLAGAVAEVLDADPLPESRIACHHNFVRRERHGDEELWVHRKGALSAREGEPGVIPGSMGSPSFHVLGRGCAASLCSSSHGAGRALSRADARRVVTERDLHLQMEGVLFDARRAASLREEAPEAYKDISKVMRAQRPLTRVVRRLRPLLSFKGG